MTLTFNTQPMLTIRHSFFPVCMSAQRRPTATTRRSSAVLSAQELRQIVKQMVD